MKRKNKKEFRRNLPEDKRIFFIEIVKIRLDGIGEATKRARITVIISIIASCSMLITLFNTYYSWTKRRGFDDSFKYKAVKLLDEESLKNKLDNQNKLSNRITGCTVEETNDICNIFVTSYEALAENDKMLEQSLKNVADIENLTKQRVVLKLKIEKTHQSILGRINQILDSDLYEKIEPSYYYELFAPKSVNLSEKEKTKKGEELREKILAVAFNSETQNYYDAKNHLNKIIIQKEFPEIEWKATVQDISIPIPLYEENKRALSKEWIENQNVRINLLGIGVNVDQFSLIGSATLMVISIWMLFSFRRENRSIVSLLRDIRKYVEFPKDINILDEKLQPDRNDILHDKWKIADLTLHGIAHNLIFSQTGKNDLPMSEKNIFVSKENTKFEIVINNFTEIIIKFIRVVSYVLLLLPAISIFLILLVDYHTTTNIIYPYSNNPIEYFINRNVNSFWQINFEIKIGIFVEIITVLVCASCIIFQKRTASALRKFEKQLGKERDRSDSLWENHVKRIWDLMRARVNHIFVNFGKLIWKTNKR